jgi:uncharacterized protein (TIGR03435 family)
MFERFTEPARRVLFFARYEASQLGSVSVGSEHLLLGLIRESDRVVRQMFDRSRLPIEAVRTEIEHHATVADDSSPDENGLGLEVKRILRLAIEEADRLLDRDIGPEHLVLGILREPDCAAASILMGYGLSLADVRDVIVIERSQQPATRRRDGALRREMRRPIVRRPDLPRSPGVHIAPTSRRPGEGAETGGDDFWALEGFTLKGALARGGSEDGAGFPELRIELPPSFDARQRYDFYLVVAAHQMHHDRKQLMHRGIEDHFHVSITREPRPTDVYVLTAPDGQNPAIRNVPDSGGGGIGCSGFSFSIRDFEGEPPTAESFQSRFPTPDLLRAAIAAGSIGGISISNGTIEEFCHLLEQGLDRLVVDETGLGGRYDIRLEEGSTSTAELLERLRSDLGLVLTPGRRDVTMLVVRPSTRAESRT